MLATDILDMNNFEIFDINNRKLHITMKCFISFIHFIFFLFIHFNFFFLLNDNQPIYLVCRYAFTITYNVWFTAITARKWEMHTMEKAVVLYIIHISIVLELKLRYLSASLQHLYRVVITKTWGSNVAQVML